MHDFGSVSDPTRRRALEVRWLDPTRRILPLLAKERGWPVSADHCVQRVLFDNAFGGVWYDFVSARPAYAHADETALSRAVAFGEATVDGAADLTDLDRRSLAWRRARPSQPGGRSPISTSSPASGTKLERIA